MYSKIAIITVFLACVLALEGILPAAFAAEESQQYCINSSHRFWEESIYLNSTLYEFNKTQNCSYGCYNGLCLPAPTESHEMSIVIGLMMVAFFFMYAGLKLDKDTHGVLQVLFMFVGMMFVIINMSVMSELADYSSIPALEAGVDSGYSLSVYVFWFVLFYFILLFFYKILVSYGKIQPLNWSL